MVKVIVLIIIGVVLLGVWTLNTEIDRTPTSTDNNKEKTNDMYREDLETKIKRIILKNRLEKYQ